MSEFGNKKTFSNNLNYYMRLNNVDRVKICSDLNLNYSTVRDWTNGRAYPRIDKIELLANYFHIQKSDLIEEQDSLIQEMNYDSILCKEISQWTRSKLEEELLIKCTMLEEENKSKILEIVNMYLKEQGDYYIQDENGRWVDSPDNIEHINKKTEKLRKQFYHTGEDNNEEK